ncbi:DUF1598 domain-containing protein [candidate division KSB1 bacterium]|nr:DUF1598 domain-containing protein [candidate division KSB1 bacterium]
MRLKWYKLLFMLLNSQLLFLYTTTYPLTTTELITQRAFSVNELQKQLAEGDDSEQMKLLSKFCGLTAIDGYMLDNKNNELILFGRVDPCLPSLYTEDFVVALRNAWMKYADLKGDTYYYSNPGCSIDPDASVINELNTKTQTLMNDTPVEEIDQAIEQWHSICRQPQTVRIMGIPFNTRFGDVMVSADYLLKRLADGSVDPGIDGFTSLLELTKKDMEKAITGGKSVSFSVTSMNRFWFFPGENKYTHNDNMVNIEQSPVTVLTEAQYLHSSGNRIVGTGQTDPYAEKFSNSFTTHFYDIAEKEPVFYKLEALFRFVALAKIMKYNNVDKTVNLDYLLNDYFIEKTEVKPNLPGISRIEKFEHRRELEDSYEIYKLWMPSCGGVGIDIEVDNRNLIRDVEKKLNKLEQRILRSRPADKALFWDLN